MFNCPNCGRPLPDDSVFCEGCGTPVSRYGAVQIDNGPAKKKGGKSPVYVAAVVVVCVAIVVGFTFCLGPLMEAVSGGSSMSASSEAEAAATSESSAAEDESADAESASADAEKSAESSGESATASSKASSSTTTSSNQSATGENQYETAVYTQYINPKNPQFKYGILVLYQKDGKSLWRYYSNVQGTIDSMARVNELTKNTKPTDSGQMTKSSKYEDVFVLSSAEKNREYYYWHKTQEINGKSQDALFEVDANGKQFDDAGEYFYLYWSTGILELPD